MHKQKGNIAETAVAHHLAKLGLPVFKEIGDSCQVDLITIINKRPVTIQVKYAELNENNSVNLSLRKTGPGEYVYYYQEDDFDLFALYIADTDQIVWISAKDALINKICISFRVDTAKKVNQHDTKRMVSNYLNIFDALY